MITKQQIETCNDGRQLAKWAGSICMGYKEAVTGLWINENKDPIYWQPHKPTEIGKAQAVDLALKYEMEVMPSLRHVTFVVGNKAHAISAAIYETWQVAVLKAALLSAIGDSDE